MSDEIPSRPWRLGAAPATSAPSPRTQLFCAGNHRPFGQALVVFQNGRWRPPLRNARVISWG
jgi:hypothetical protein